MGLHDQEPKRSTFQLRRPLPYLGLGKVKRRSSVSHSASLSAMTVASLATTHAWNLMKFSLSLFRRSFNSSKWYICLFLLFLLTICCFCLFYRTRDDHTLFVWLSRKCTKESFLFLWLVLVTDFVVTEGSEGWYFLHFFFSVRIKRKLYVGVF